MPELTVTEEQTKVYEPARSLTDAELVVRIGNDYNQAESDKRADHVRCRRYMKIYEALNQAENVIKDGERGIADDRRIFSDTYYPIGAATVDTAAAGIYNSFFGVPDFMEIDANDYLDDRAAQRITAHLYKRFKEMKFKHTVYRAIQMALTFDYAVTLSTWKLEAGFVPKRVPTTEIREFGPVKRSYRDIKMELQWQPDATDRSNVLLLDYFCCFHDAKSKNGLEDSEFFIDVRWESIEKLNSGGLLGKYKNVEKVRKMAEQLASDVPRDDKTSNNKSNATMARAGKVRIVRYWTHSHVAEKCFDFIISRRDIRGMPIQVWKIHDLPSQFRGMGIIQRLERPQYDMNAIINTKRDFQNLALNPIAILDRELASVNDNKLELYPGRVLFTPDGRIPKDMVHFVQPGFDMSASSTEEFVIQKDAIEKISGFSENATGAYAQGRKTARETSAVASGALSKIFTVASKLEETCLEPIYLEMFLLEQAFMSRNEQFKYHGKHSVDWVVVTPQDYKWSAVPSFMARGTTLVSDKQIHIQQFMVALDRAAAFPQIHDMHQIFLEMWKLMSPRDYQRFVKDPTENELNIPQDLENQLLAQGKQVDVTATNDHQTHIAEMDKLFRSVDFQVWPEALKIHAQEHYQKHQQAAQASQIQQAQPPTDDGGSNSSSDLAKGLRGTSVGVTP